MNDFYIIYIYENESNSEWEAELMCKVHDDIRGTCLGTLL